ncbi:MAG: tRNA U55 pseudouridine synthase [Faunusvirus sp.]|jgi:tRNA U55 pseudouridine synthase TruB|uniref:tRNA pseudouridine(55) synthase n=1 Tax=Faunusvirus sp. TaxID=2487766 RepID=A0A3G4ZVT9_9VIRU|nr:MAG: tRNA U55 pseudouridine synthase [Faunusvirus sp.]
MSEGEIILVDKPTGMSCVDFVKRYHADHPHIKKLSFAGRLDELASGKLYILTENKIYLRDELCRKYKTYTCTVIKHIVTDSYDILGMPAISDAAEQKIPNKYSQPYPPYSSVPIKRYRKPFWYVTRHKLPLDIAEIPVKQVEIKQFTRTKEHKISPADLLDIIVSRIKLVDKKHDFRQAEIVDAWTELLKNHKNDIELVDIAVQCSSGTYIRSIANMMAGCAFDIQRTAYL